ncbi:MAG: DUF5615 family PIN-like protein [Verrucomicrobiota bacterium]
MPAIPTQPTGSVALELSLMKLLFDENLSFRLPALLTDLTLKSFHVDAFALGGKTDEEIWTFANNNGMPVVSKDSDFSERAILRGSPPKVIWLRIGNCSTNAIVDLLTRNRIEIVDFLNSEEDILTLI